MSTNYPLEKMLSYSEIADKVAELLNRSGVGAQIPIPLETIAAFLGYKALSFGSEDDKTPYKDLGGLTISTEKGKIMAVNKTLPLFRQRAILAEMVGYVFLNLSNPQKIHVVSKEGSGGHRRSEPEIFANIMLGYEMPGQDILKHLATGSAHPNWLRELQMKQSGLVS